LLNRLSKNVHYPVMSPVDAVSAGTAVSTSGGVG